MNSSEIFCLSWNDFQQNISESFHALRREEDFFDVTLACDDEHQIEAHKVVLSSCSPVFKQLLKKNKHHHPLLYFRGLKKVDLEHVLEYIYSGQVSIFQEHLDSFLAIAEELQLKGLSNVGSKSAGVAGGQMPFHTKTPENLLENPTNISNVGYHNKTLNMDNFRCRSTTEINRILYNKSQDMIKSIGQVNMKESGFPAESFRQNDFYSLDYFNGGGNLVIDESEVGANNIGHEDFDETIKSMIEKVDKCWYCKVCGQEFITKEKTKLLRHVERFHTTGFTHTCAQCGKCCPSKEAFREHQRKFHPDKIGF